MFAVGAVFALGASGLALVGAAPAIASGATTVCAGSGCDYSSITAAIAAVPAGSTIDVAAGTYRENVVVNKQLTIKGAGDGETTVVATDGNATPLTFGRSSNGSVVSGFTFTHDYTSLEKSSWDFNNNGVGMYGSGDTLSDSTVELSRNGVYINASQGNTLKNDHISNNRTGINVAGVADGLTVAGSSITDNWTLGLVLYPTSSATDLSKVSLNNNTITGNWYGQVEVKSGTTGTPGATSGTLDVSSDDFGDAPVTYTTTGGTDLSEPGFADLHPASLGGSATAPKRAYADLRIFDSPHAAIDTTAQKELRVGTIDGLSDYTSVQDAVDAADPGDIVQIQSGSYTGPVTVDKSLTLAGAGSATVLTGSGTDAGIAVKADDVTVKDLTVSGFDRGVQVFDSGATIDHVTSTGNADYGLEVKASKGVAAIKNLTVKSSSFTHNNVGLKVETTATLDGLTVSDSHFDANVDGWYIGNRYTTDRSAQSTVTDVRVSDTTFNKDSEEGIYAEKLSHATFDTVTVHDSGTGSYANTTGIILNLKYGDYSDIKVVNSTISDSATGAASGAPTGAGLDIEARNDGASYGGDKAASLSNVTVTGNTLTGNQVGVRLFGGIDATSVTLTGNTITGNADAALQNQLSSGSVDASLNWWGSAKPDFAKIITGKVVYKPWYVNDALDATSATVTTMTNLEAPSAMTKGESVDATVSVTPSDAKGTITLYDGKNVLASGENSPAGLKAALSSLAKGAHTLRATFTPKSTLDYAASTSSDVTVQVNVKQSPGSAPASTADQLEDLIKDNGLDVSSTTASFTAGPDSDNGTLTSLQSDAPLTGTLPWSSDADSYVDVYAYSSPVYIGTFSVVDGKVQLDADLSALEAGGHHLVFVGQTSNAVKVMAITVAPANSGSGNSAGNSNGGTSNTATGDNDGQSGSNNTAAASEVGELAVTGAALAPVLTIGAGALLLGLAVVIVAGLRRRREAGEQ